MTSHLNIFADQVRPVMLRVYLNVDGYFQQDYAFFHGTDIIQEREEEFGLRNIKDSLRCLGGPRYLQMFPLSIYRMRLRKPSQHLDT